MGAPPHWLPSRLPSGAARKSLMLHRAFDAPREAMLDWRGAGLGWRRGPLAAGARRAAAPGFAAPARRQPRPGASVSGLDQPLPIANSTSRVDHQLSIRKETTMAALCAWRERWCPLLALLVAALALACAPAAPPAS